VPGVPVSAHNEGGGAYSIAESGWYREAEAFAPGWGGAFLFG